MRSTERNTGVEQWRLMSRVPMTRRGQVARRLNTTADPVFVLQNIFSFIGFWGNPLYYPGVMSPPVFTPIAGRLAQPAAPAAARTRRYGGVARFPAVLWPHQRRRPCAGVPMQPVQPRPCVRECAIRAYQYYHCPNTTSKK